MDVSMDENLSADDILLDEEEEEFKDLSMMIPLTFDCSRDLMRKLVQDITPSKVEDNTRNMVHQTNEGRVSIT